MKVTLLSVGKTKNAHYADLEDEYIRRTRGRFSCDQIYVKNDRELVQHAHNMQGTVILLDEHGAVMNSREFAEYVDRSIQQAPSNQLIFVIGDAEGLPQELRALSGEIVALSEMTFPHELARVVFFEQLYRAQTILDGHPYHK